MTNVVIAIPTFRRPKMLKRLLSALEEQETGAAVSVIVVDNDAYQQQGLDICHEVAASYRWPLSAAIEAERGIAQVRNALVATALEVDGVDFIAMVDDDEWPARDWLEKLLAMQQATNADALGGAIIFQLERGAFRTIRDIRGDSGIVTNLHGASNLLLRASLLRKIARPWFDPAFALTGGEDADFFLRLKAAGASFAWADEAIAFSTIPESRGNVIWMLQRAFSHGNSGMLVLLKHQRRPRVYLLEIAKSGVALLTFPLLALLMFPFSNRMWPLEKMFRAAGKISALLGYRYKEYTTVHGE